MLLALMLIISLCMLKRLKMNDIYLIVLHEMLHVLGVGTLWPGFICGTGCVVGGERNQTRYECNNANSEFAKIYGSNANLHLAPKDCSHWSGETNIALLCNKYSYKIN